MKKLLKRYINNENSIERNIITIFIILSILIILAGIIVLLISFAFFRDVFDAAVVRLATEPMSFPAEMNEWLTYSVVLFFISTVIEFIRRSISMKLKPTSKDAMIFWAYMVFEVCLYNFLAFFQRFL